MGKALGRGLLFVAWLALLGLGLSLLRQQPDDARVRADLGALVDATRLYRIERGEYPSRLSQMLAGGRGHTEPFLRARPRDPWGHDYELLRPEPWHYVLLSYGADGLPGGEGAGVDLGFSSQTGYFLNSDPLSVTGPTPWREAPRRFGPAQLQGCGLLALAGLAPLLLGLGRRQRRAVERALREEEAALRSLFRPAPSPAVAVRPRGEARAPEGLICAYCHDEAELAATICPRCGTVLHAECWQQVTKCPTIGCGIRPVRASRVRLEPAIMQEPEAREAFPAAPQQVSP